MQSIVNAVYGVAVGVGLYFLDVPYPLVWAMLGAALRFIPYVGPVLAAGAPILVSLAALPGWTRPLEVIALFTGLELFTNLVLETVLYAGAAGVSQVALLVSVAFWTWLWGPLGLLMATPLTVCLVVLGKHVPGLQFFSMLMADTPALAPEYVYYQRLLARDQSEAADIIERHIKAEPSRTVFDALLLPALNYAERDRLEQRLSPEEEVSVMDATRELIADAVAAMQKVSADSDTPVPVPAASETRQPLSVLGYAANGVADEIALTMLAHLLQDLPVRIEVTRTRMLTADVVALIEEQSASVLCIADLPPSAPSKTRYLVKRLRSAFPELRIIVGRWAPPALADETTQVLRDAGASRVDSTLADTANYLAGLVEVPRIPGVDAA
jgi:hypothetical protein